MKIISQNKENRIKNSFDRICNNCDIRLSETIRNSQLIITDDSNAETIYNDEYNLFKKAYSEGFGGVKGNVTYENEKYHLIVLNITQIDNFKLTDNELDGVLSHELGHIFNENPKREIPSILNGATQTDIDNVKKTIKIETETYPDYFAKRTNCSQGLVSSINKYLGSDICKNAELFQERLNQLAKEEDLLGSIKPIK